MASRDTQNTVLLQYKVDSASAAKVSSNIEDLVAEIEQLQTQLRAVGRDGAAGIAGLNRELPRTESGLQSLQDEVIRLRNELKSLDDLTVTPVVDVQRTGGAGAGVNLDSIDRAGSIGSQVLSGLGAGEAANAAGLISDVVSGFSSLNPVMLAATAAGAGFALVLGESQKAFEAAQEAARAYLDRQVEINALLRQGDTAQLEADRQRLQLDISSRTDALARYEEILRRYDDAQLALQDTFNNANDEAAQAAIDARIQAEQDLADASQGTITNFDALRAEINRLSTEVSGYKNDLAQTEAALSGVVNKLVEIGDKSDIALGKAGKVADKFGSIMGGIADGMTPLEDIQRRLDDAKNARSSAEGAAAYLSAVTATTDAQANLTKAMQAYKDAVTASEARIAEINTRLSEALAEAESTRLDGLAEAEARAGADQIAAKERYEARKQDISDRYDRAALTAIGNRDALAKEQADRAAEDEKKAASKEYADSLKAAKTALDRQTAIVEAAYRKQVQTAQSAATAAVNTERAAQQARLQTLEAGVTAAKTLLINAENGMAAIRNQYYNYSIQAAQVWSSTLALYTSAAFALPGGTTSPYNPKQPGIIGKATGGPIYPGQTVLVGERGSELVTPLAPAYVHPHGSTPVMANFNFAGATVETIDLRSRQAALKAFNSILDKLAG